MSSFDDDNTQKIDYWQVVRNHWGVILLTLILCSVTAFAITTLIEPKYSAYTSFQVKPDSFVLQSSNKGGLTQDRDRNFLETQRQAMTSYETLKIADGGVVDGRAVRRFSAGLGDDHAVALSRLRKRIVVEVKLGSSIMEVTTIDADKTTARELADAVRTAYLTRRLKDRVGLSKTTKTKLEADYNAAKERRDDLKEQLAKSSKDSKLPYTAEELPDWQNQAKKEYDSKTAAMRETQDDIKRFELLANEVTLLENDADLIAHLGTSTSIIAKPRAIEVYNNLIELKSDRASLLIAGYGVNHPKIKTVDQLLTQKEEELTVLLESVRKEVKNILVRKRAELKLIEDSIASLKEKYGVETKNYNNHRYIIEEFQLAKTELTRLTVEQKEIQDQFAYYNAPIVLEEPARLPTSPISPNIPLIMGVGTAAGLIFGLSIAFLIELMDTSVKTMEDVEKYLKVPVLAVVPQDVGLLHLQNGITPDAEAYRILRTNIEFNRKSPDANALTVVSGGAGEGKSTTLLNLAYICAQGGYTTLIIDADLRRPKMHTYLGVENRIGLSNFLTTDISLENVVVKTKTENLFFMPSGVLPQDAAGILNSRRMTEMITEVKSRFDLVLVDSPPILGVSDASVISSEVDHTMIVIQHRKLPRKLLQRVKQSVEAVGGDIIGVVLNNVDVRSDTEYQYYTSYYSYYSPTALKEAEELAKHQNVEPDSTAKKSDGDLY